MYFYYFLSSVLSKEWFTTICKPVAPIITTMQTSQMAVRLYYSTQAPPAYCTLAASLSDTSCSPWVT